MRALWGLVLLLGCGDPRAPYVGSYNGTFTETTFYSDGPDAHSGQATFGLTEVDPDRLQFSVKCKFTAKVIDADTIQFDPIACPSERATTNSGALATFTDTYNSGTGKLTNKTLVITQDAERVGTNYTDGTPGSHVNFRLNITATQQ